MRMRIEPSVWISGDEMNKEQLYDFDEPWSRAYCADDLAATDNTDEDERAGVMNLEGADWRFKTAPCIRRAMRDFADDGSFPYINAGSVPYRNSVVWWMAHARSWKIDPAWVVPTYGVLQGMCVALRAFTRDGDGVLTLSPYYGLYRRVLERANRALVDVPLVNSEGVYSIDFDALEAAMRRSRAMILCNPHNPIMKIWPEADLRRIGELAARYDVLVLSDEIFAEHAYDGRRTTPFEEAAAAGCRYIVCTSLGKCFNLVGCNEGTLIIPDDALRAAFIAQRDHDHFGSLNPLNYAILRAAYTREGLDWIRASMNYVSDNIRRFREAFEPFGVIFSPHEAGSLIWSDWRNLGMTNDALKQFFRKEARVLFDNGEFYAEPRGFCRCQMGLPRPMLEEAIERIFRALEARGLKG